MILEGWTAHDGGECPVADDTHVNVMFRDGLFCWDDRATTWIWEHLPNLRDWVIIAYQEVKQ